MPSPSRRARQVLFWLLFLLLLASGFGVLRHSFYATARRTLDRWEAAGFPGDPPRGRGPSLVLDWPPRLLWRDVHWRSPEGIEADCDAVEAVITRRSVLGGPVRLRRVEMTGLRLRTGRALERWIDPVLLALSQPPPGGSARAAGGVSTGAEPQEDAVRFLIAPMQVDGSEEIGAVEGWVRATPGRWQASGRAIGRSGAELPVQAEGSGAGGIADVDLRLDASATQSVSLRSRRPPGGEPRWSLSARDDGTILRALAPAPLAPSIAAGSRLELNVTQGDAGGGLRAEARFDPLRMERRGSEPAEVTGLLCLEDGIAQLSDLRIARGSDFMEGSVHLPVASGRTAPASSMAGTWAGEPLTIRGDISREPESWSIDIGAVHKGAARAGPIHIRLSADSLASSLVRGPGLRLSGEARLGAGRIVLERGWKGDEEPAILWAMGVPLAELVPWLPFELPGAWSGLVDGRAELLARSDGRWSGTGTVLVRDGTISGLALLEEIRSLWADERGAVRFEQVAGRWTYEGGRLLADSLGIDARDIRVAGALVFDPPDSVFGLLRVSPGERGELRSILRLLGGEETSLHLGIRGDPSAPDLIPLDRDSRPRWGLRLERIRRSLAG